MRWGGWVGVGGVRSQAFVLVTVICNELTRSLSN